MLKKLIGAAWRKTPKFMRLPIIRATQKKFTVSAAAVVVNAKNEVLLLNHIIRPFYTWGLPGGFLEYGEQPKDGLIRELSEETGLKLTNIVMINVQTINRHVEMLFRAESEGDPQVKSIEISEAQWFAFDEMPEKLSPVQKSFIRQVLDSEV